MCVLVCVWEESSSREMGWGTSGSCDLAPACSGTGSRQVTQVWVNQADRLGAAFAAQDRTVWRGGCATRAGCHKRLGGGHTPYRIRTLFLAMKEQWSRADSTALFLVN